MSFKANRGNQFKVIDKDHEFFGKVGTYDPSEWDTETIWLVFDGWKRREVKEWQIQGPIY